MDLFKRRQRKTNTHGYLYKIVGGKAMVATCSGLTRTNVMCEFRIIGDDFEPDIITEKLKVVPSKVWRQGEKINQRDKVREYSNWGLSTEYEESYDINEQINKVLIVFKNKKQELLQLKDLFHLDYKIEIVINVESNETPAIYLEKEIIQFCNDVGAIIDFDLYIF